MGAVEGSGMSSLFESPNTGRGDVAPAAVSAGLAEHLLNGVAYCRMIWGAGRPVDFVYLYVNPAFRSLTGLGDVVGRRVSEVIPGLPAADSGLLYAWYECGWLHPGRAA